jgi:hypothetical protein
MESGSSEGSEARFAAYVEALGVVLGHADRQQPMHDYCLGLLMPIARKSVEPMAAVTAPAQVAAKHQSFLHFVGNAPWSDAAMLAKVGELVLPALERRGPIEAWIIDDTGFPKKGQHSVGVTRQYCGQLGKQDNCQSLPPRRRGSRYRCRWPTTMPACRSRIGFICPRVGPTTRGPRRGDTIRVEIDRAFRKRQKRQLAQLSQAVRIGLGRRIPVIDPARESVDAGNLDIVALHAEYFENLAYVMSFLVISRSQRPCVARRLAGRRSNGI